MSRLREGCPDTARGAAHFLRETVGRVRYAGASGRLTLRADSGFYAHAIVAVCRKMNVRYSITIRQHKSLQNLSEAKPEADWMPTPSQSEPDATTVRRIVRRVRPTPSPQLALFSKHSYHGFITDQDGDNPGTGGRPSPPRRGRECHPRPEVRRRPEPHVVRVLRRQRRLVGGTGDDPQPGPLSSGHRSGWAGREHEDPQTTVLLPGWTAHPSGPPSHPAYSPALALGNLVQSCPGAASCHFTPGLTAPGDRPITQPRSPPFCPAHPTLGLF